jgi:hypothetical protein
MNSNISYLLKKIKRLELILSKEVPPVGKFQIKYGFKEFEIRNNFPYWKVSKFRIESELKNKEGSKV